MKNMSAGPRYWRSSRFPKLEKWLAAAFWKASFDAHGAARARAGVIGHAINRSTRNPNVVVIYLQAASLDALHAFAAAPDLKEVMQAAGVVGAPELAFVNGGAWQV